MVAKSVNAEKLLRQVITSVAQLPAPELMVVYETIAILKQKDAKGEHRLSSAEIVARAKQRASEMSHLSHEEAVQRFIIATDKIRTEAIEKGLAIEGEWESD